MVWELHGVVMRNGKGVEDNYGQSTVSTVGASVGLTKLAHLTLRFLAGSNISTNLIIK